MQVLISLTYHKNNLETLEIIKQIPNPITVGSSIAIPVHLKLPVSFFIVRQVVEQGQCIKKIIIVQIAVIMFQPLAIKIFLISYTFDISTNSPVDKYAISIIGITISFAGKPKINAIKITPSIPNKLANGFKKVVQCVSILTPDIFKLANIHINIPAGSATEIALPSTNSVLSNKERTITFPNLWSSIWWKFQCKR